MHEVGRRQRHQPQDVDLVSDDLRLHTLRDLFLLDAEAARLLSVEGTALSDQNFAQLVRHVLLILEEDLEEVASEHGQVLLLEELRVDLGEGVEARVDLVLWN